MDYPDWGPDGAIYVSIDSNVPAPDSPPLTFEIWRVDPATGDAEAVLTRQDEMTVEQPRVSPDGSQLVYIRVRDIYEETGWAIFVADMTAGANGPERQLTDWDLFAATPDWSSDNWIAFNTNDLRLRNGEPHHVYRMAPDGRLEQLETFDPDDPTTPVEAAHPRWTADGRTMTFSLLLDGEPYLATMDADGSSQQLVPGPVWGGFSELRPVGD
jgi:Tol biopolymer transport system component